MVQLHMCHLLALSEKLLIPIPKRHPKMVCSCIALEIYFHLNLSITTYIFSVAFSGLAPLQASMGFPSSLNSFGSGYSPWDDSSMLINAQSDGIAPSQDDFTLHGIEGVSFM